MSIPISSGLAPIASRETVVRRAQSLAPSISRYLEGVCTPMLAEASIIGLPSVFVPDLVVTMITPLAALEP